MFYILMICISSCAMYSLSLSNRFHVMHMINMTFIYRNYYSYAYYCLVNEFSF